MADTPPPLGSTPADHTRTWDREALRQFGHSVVDFVADYLERIDAGRVHTRPGEEVAFGGAQHRSDPRRPAPDVKGMKRKCYGAEEHKLQTWGSDE